ncbi:hypothetical protein KA012_03615 [Candidatus Woesebacteria bacterium]|nr:hypothetical protein [Candidatus Woesebacteria bacterium]
MVSGLLERFQQYRHLRQVDQAERTEEAQVAEKVHNLLWPVGDDLRFSRNLFSRVYDLQQTPPHIGLMTSDNQYLGSDARIESVKFQSINKVTFQEAGRVFEHDHGADRITEILILEKGSKYPGLPKPSLVTANYAVYKIEPGVRHGSDNLPAYGRWISIKYKSETYIPKPEPTYFELIAFAAQAETHFAEMLRVHAKAEVEPIIDMPLVIHSALIEWRAAQEAVLNRMINRQLKLRTQANYERRTAQHFYRHGFDSIADEYFNAAALMEGHLSAADTTAATPSPQPQIE